MKSRKKCKEMELYEEVYKLYNLIIQCRKSHNSLTNLTTEQRRVVELMRDIIYYVEEMEDSE